MEINTMNKQDNVPQVKSVEEVLTQYALNKERAMLIDYRADDVISAMGEYAAPFQSRISELEAERDKLKIHLETLVFAAKRLDKNKEWHNPIKQAEQALNSKEVGG